MESVKRAEVLDELLGELQKKDFAVHVAMDGICVSFRFALGRVDHTFPSTSSVKVRCAEVSEVTL